MNAPKKQSDAWEACELGTLSEVELPPVESGRRKFLRTAAYLCVGGIVTTIGLNRFLQTAEGIGDQPIVPTACDEVMVNLDALVAERLTNVAFKQTILEHLEECVPCRSAYFEKRGEESTPAPSVPVPPGGKPNCCHNHRKTSASKERSSAAKSTLGIDSTSSIPQ